MLTSCTGEAPEPEIVTISDEEADEDARKIMAGESISTEFGLEVSLWASEKLLEDPIALDMDDQGRAWVTVTNRRSRSEFTVTRSSDWMIESLGLESVEERREFVRRELPPSRSDENRWIADHNEDGIRDWRDFTVLKEEVRRIEDLSGDGRANRSQLFIRDFHEEVTDLAGGVLHHNGDVFVAVGPDLWRIRDTNGDGLADTKDSISHGYNIHAGISGHGMSGLTVGPDGRVWWGVGDHGMNVTDQDGNNWFYSAQGTILRSEPDGSNFEVFASGLRNPHEFSFDKYGNLITVDHDGDYADEYERLVYLVDGSDSGWRTHWQFGKYTDPKNNDYLVWMDEGYSRTRFDGQTSHILPPIALYHTGPAGMAYNPGTALSDEWKDYFFVASFPAMASRSVIYAFNLKEKGASFELDNDYSLVTGILATGLDVGPDGALYFADWLQGWGPNNQGRIWKLDAPGQAGSDVRRTTRELVAEDFSDRPADELQELLAHENMRVRQKAQFELAGRGDEETLRSAIGSGEKQIARIHGIWGLGQLGRREPDAVAPLVRTLGDRDPEIRAQSARVLGDVRHRPAGEALLPLLADEHARVRFFAAEALGRLACRQAQEPIVEMLRANNDEDVYLRHAGSLALSRIGDGEFVAALSEDPSRAVRIAAVAALKRMEDPGVARFLRDEDEWIVTDAARAINDDAFIEEALGELAQMLDQNRFVNEPLIRRAINANLYLGSAAESERLAEFALRQDVADEMRAEALKALSSWPDPSLLDRVTGRYRGPVDNDAVAASQALKPVANRLLAIRESETVKIAAMEAVATLGLKAGIPAVLALLERDLSADVRISALEALEKLGYGGIEGAAGIAMRDTARPVRVHALAMIRDLPLDDKSKVELLLPILEEGSVEEQQVALKTLGTLQNEVVIPVFDRQMDLLVAGELPEEVRLELLEAVEELNEERLNARLEQYRTAESEGDVISRYPGLLRGGDAESGRNIFFRNTAARCIRCHTVDGQGGDAGPDLTEAGLRLSREELLEALVDPAATLTPGYGVVSVTLAGGETLQGVLEEETGTTLTLVPGGGERHTVEKSQIEERVNAGSAMPAMGELLSRRELRDLVEYMSTLK